MESSVGMTAVPVIATTPRAIRLTTLKPKWNQDGGVSSRPKQPQLWIGRSARRASHVNAANPA